MKEKKTVKVWRIILTVIIAVSAGIGGGFAFVNARLNNINHVESEPEVVIEPSMEEFDTQEGLDDTMDPDDIVWNNDEIEKLQSEEIHNFLLIGQDRRQGEERQRSDCMIICTLNTKTNKIILTSVMRDMYVPIPGYSDNRINAAYQFGGMELLDEVIENCLGIHIDGNVEVDFEGFISLFAEVGDISIELNEAEANYLNENYNWNLEAGENKLTPEQALAYSRIRYVGHSDWERTDRQRKVMIAAFDNVKDMSIPQLIALSDKLFKNVTTDMGNADILNFIYLVAINGMTDIESYRLPAEGTYTCETLRKGMEVLVPDLKANAEYMQKYMNE